MSKILQVSLVIGGLLTQTPVALARSPEESTCLPDREALAFRAFLQEQEDAYRKYYIESYQTETERLKAEADLAKIFISDNKTDLAFCFFPVGKFVGAGGKLALKVPFINRVAHKWAFTPIKKLGHKTLETGGRVAAQVAEKAGQVLKKGMTSSERAMVEAEIKRLDEYIVQPHMAWSSSALVESEKLPALTSFWRREYIFKNYGPHKLSKVLVAEKQVLKKNLAGEGQEYLQMAKMSEEGFAKLLQDTGRAVKMEDPWPQRVVEMEKYLENLKTASGEVTYRTASDEIIAKALGKDALIDMVEHELHKVKSANTSRVLGKLFGRDEDTLYKSYLNQSYNNYRHKLAKYLQNMRKEKPTLTRETADRQALRKKFLEDGDEYTKINKVFRYQRSIDNLNNEIAVLAKENSPEALATIGKITQGVLPILEAERNREILSLGGIGLIMRERLKQGKSILLDNFKKVKAASAKKVAGQTAYHMNNLLFPLLATGVTALGAYGLQHYWFNEMICTTTPQKIEKAKREAALARELYAKEHPAEAAPAAQTSPAPKIQRQPASVEVGEEGGEEDGLGLYTVQVAEAYDGDEYDFSLEPVTVDDLRTLYEEQSLVIDEEHRDAVEAIYQAPREGNLWQRMTSLVTDKDDDPQYGGKARAAARDAFLKKLKLARAVRELLDQLPVCERQELLAELNATYATDVRPEGNNDERRFNLKKRPAEHQLLAAPVLEQTAGGQVDGGN